MTRPIRRVALLVPACLALLAPAAVAAQEAEELEALPEAEARLYADSGEFRFANGRDALDIPFELNSDKIYLAVEVNGLGPFWMILDTGSPGLVLDTATAERLHLATGETGETTGAGEAGFPITAVEEPVRVGLPGLELLGQTAAVGPLDAVIGPFEGRRLEGALGCFSLLTKFEVEIDYGARRIHVRPPREAEPPPGALIVPVDTQWGHPLVEGSLLPQEGEEVPGVFLVDTGMRGSLLLPTAYVDAQSLLTRSGRTAYVTSGGGIGGQVFTHLGRLRRLSFGGVSLDNVPVNMSQAREGLLASPDWSTGGIIGSDVLQRFRVIFDYAHQRLLLIPRPYDADDLDVDKSGHLFLVSEVDDRSVVRVGVAEGSARGGGVRVGDVVREIDGEPARPGARGGPTPPASSGRNARGSRRGAPGPGPLGRGRAAPARLSSARTSRCRRRTDSCSDRGHDAIRDDGPASPLLRRPAGAAQEENRCHGVPRGRGAARRALHDDTPWSACPPTAGWSARSRSWRGIAGGRSHSALPCRRGAPSRCPPTGTRRTSG
ncbi:MAG: pepsin/retropepsin-like aspartic protease family protein [Thermoanaerobaculia bacterium]